MAVLDSLGPLFSLGSSGRPRRALEYARVSSDGSGGFERTRAVRPRTQRAQVRALFTGFRASVFGGAFGLRVEWGARVGVGDAVRGRAFGLSQILLGIRKN